MISDSSLTKRCSQPVPASAKISSWLSISQSETEIQEELFSLGPLSVLLDATQLQFYKSGVWTGHISSSPAILGCSKTGLNHAVLLVGYGVDDSASPSTPYWIVKNSWGVNWGEEGYFRITRGTGACGINTAVTSAVI
jgi:cathepsin F